MRRRMVEEPRTHIICSRRTSFVPLPLRDGVAGAVGAWPVVWLCTRDGAIARRWNGAREGIARGSRRRAWSARRAWRRARGPASRMPSWTPPPLRALDKLAC